ncbi:Fic family protein [Niabella aurantiaca]
MREERIHWRSVSGFHNYFVYLHPFPDGNSRIPHVFQIY